MADDPPKPAKGAALAWLSALIVIALAVVWLIRWQGANMPASPTTSLPRQPLSQALQRTADDLDRIVMQDGTAGWFVIDDVATALAQDIGIHGQRLGFAMLGAARHIPIYCGGDDAILWGVRQDQISGALAFCNADRLDLSALRPLARKATMQAGMIAAADLPAFTAQRDAQVAAGTSAWVIRPRNDQAHPFKRRIMLPLLWPEVGNPAAQSAYFALQDVITATVTRHLAAWPTGWAMAIRADYPPTLTVFAPPPDSTPLATGLAYQDATGRAMILPEEAFTKRYILDVTCEPAVCAALEGLDFGDIFTPHRDPALLKTWLAQAMPLGQQRDDLWPVALWDDADIRLGATQPVLLPYRYVTFKGADSP